MTASRRGKRSKTDFDTARKLALALPGVEEGTSYGTPAFRVRGKLFARLHEDGECLVVRADLDIRDLLLQADPRAFLVTDHYRAHPWVLARLGTVSRDQLGEVLEQAWRQRASRRLVQEFDANP